jgi:hypothetical protein
MRQSLGWITFSYLKDAKNAITNYHDKLEPDGIRWICKLHQEPLPKKLNQEKIKTPKITPPQVETTIVSLTDIPKTQQNSVTQQIPITEVPSVIRTEPGTNLFVTGFPDTIPKSRIINLFERCGDLVHSNVSQNNKYKGQVVVKATFQDPEAAKIFKFRFHEKDPFKTGVSIFVMENKNTFISTSELNPVSESGDAKATLGQHFERAKNTPPGRAPGAFINPGPNGATLSIRGIPEFATREQIHTLLKQHGKILKLFCGKDKRFEDRQQVFVSFSNVAAADFVKNKYGNTDPFNWGSGVNLAIFTVNNDQGKGLLQARTNLQPAPVGRTLQNPDPNVTSSKVTKFSSTMTSSVLPPPTFSIDLPLPQLGALPPPNLPKTTNSSINLHQKISAPPIPTYSPTKPHPFKTPIKPSTSNQVAVSNNDYPARLLQQIQTHYLNQTKSPFLNTSILHPGRGNTLARYHVNSHMMYLGSPEVFSKIHVTRSETGGLRLPAELDPNVLKCVIDYFHGHPLNVSLNPPDMSVLPEIYIAAVYFKLGGLVDKIELTVRMNYSSLRAIAEGLVLPVNVNE